ncbi:MAG: eIF2A-related protein [Treponema sp.]
MKKHIFLFTLFALISGVLIAQSNTRRIEAKKKGGVDSAYVTHTMNKPEIVFNSMHSGTIESIAYSPDGKYIASGSSDGTIKIWEAETGRLLRTLTGHADDIYSVSYSPDGAYLASGSNDKTIRIWEVKTGACIKTLTGHTSYVRSVTYSPDGAYLASGSWDETVKIWEIATGECIKTLSGHTDDVGSVAYSPDGAYLASGSDDKTVKLWKVATGECVKTFEGHTDEVNSVYYSPDGKYLASGSDDKTIKLWEVANGKCIKTLTEHTYHVRSVAYSPDGKYLVSSSSLWEVASGDCVKTLSGGYVAYSPDGVYLASGGAWEIQIWKVPTGESVREIVGNLSKVYSVAYSLDGKYLASTSIGGTKVWEAKNGRYIKALEGHGSFLNSVSYNPNGKYIASGSDDNTVKIFEVATGECIKTFEGHTDEVNSVCYSSDGAYLASAAGKSLGNEYGCADRTIKIWEVASGKCVKTLEGHTDAVLSVSFSPNNKYLASGSTDETIKIWEVANGKCIKTLTEHRYHVESVAYSPDGKYLASGSRDRTINIYEAESGILLKTFKFESPVTSVCYSPDGKYLASSSWDGSIKIWNVATEQCINTLTGHTEWVNSVCYSPDGAYLVSGSSDYTIRFWNASTGELLATTFNLDDEEWLTFTPEGFFVGSDWATKNFVHIVDGMKTIGIDQMYDFLYRPDLISAKLSGEDISSYAKNVNFTNIVRSGSAPITAFLNLDEEITNRDVAIEYSIQNTGGGIGEVNLLLNGKNIRLAENVPSKSGQTLYFSHTVTLQNGENTLELYAKNEAGKIESLRARKILNWHGKAKKPNLYIFTVAINKYRDRRLQLKYAVPDAEFILKGFSNQKKSLYQNIVTYNLFDDNVTKDGLKSTFEKLSTQIQADDVFVFYIAGHGITYDEDGDYYYLPSNFRFTSSEAIQQQGISKNDLIRYLSLIKAGKTLILMDTCNAGSFLGNNTRGLSEQTAIDRLTRSTGHATIVASSDDQVAMEGYEGHGIFTYILVEGLSGKADADGDGFITLQELSAYAEEEVPRRSYEKWGYEQTPMRDLRKQDFPIYMR